MALDEPKDDSIDETYEFDGLNFVVEKQLLKTSGGICVDFIDKGYFGGYQIEPKIPLSGGGGDCGTCSC